MSLLLHVHIWGLFRVFLAPNLNLASHKSQIGHAIPICIVINSQDIVVDIWLCL